MSEMKLLPPLMDKAKADQLRGVAEAKLADLEGKIKSLKLDEQRLQEGMATTRQRLTNERDGLRQQIREASEASAKELDEVRMSVRMERAGLAREKEGLQTAKGFTLPFSSNTKTIPFVQM